MDIKLQLLKKEIKNTIDEHFCDLNIDANNIADTNAIKILHEIQEVIKSDLSDFYAIEEIVKIFEKYEIDFTPRHDF